MDVNKRKTCGSSFYNQLIILIVLLSSFGTNLYAEVKADNDFIYDENRIISEIGLRKNANVKVISRYITEENANLNEDKPPRPWADSRRNILDIDNDWLKSEGNIVKAMYPAQYIAIDIYTPKIDSMKLDKIEMKYGNKHISFSYRRSASSHSYEIFDAPAGFYLAVVTANVGEGNQNNFPAVPKGTKVNVNLGSNYRIATVYLLPDAANEQQNNTDYMGYLVKYSQYQKANPGTNASGKPTKVQERYRKGRTTSETLVGTFSIKTNSQQRNIEIERVEDSISKTNSNSQSTSNSISVGSSTTASVEGGFGPVKAKASTTISTNATTESKRQSSASSTQNSGSSNQSTTEASLEESKVNTYQSSTTVNYDGKETEIITQLQQVSGKTYQPSPHITNWLTYNNILVTRYDGKLKDMGMEFRPYVISSVEEMGEYTLTASRVNVINTLVNNEQQFLVVLDILAEKFSEIMKKDSTFQPQHTTIVGVRNELRDGYYFQFVQILSDNWGGYQHDLASNAGSGSAVIQIQHMLNDTIVKNTNKWQRALANGELPLDLLDIMGLDDKYSIEAINRSGILKIQEKG